MIRYIIGRLIGSALVLLAVTALVFVLVRLTPGDPVGSFLGFAAFHDPRQAAALRHTLGFDRPVAIQYLFFLGRMFHGDLGQDPFTGEPVTKLLAERAPATLELAILTLIFSTVIAVFLGATAATHRGRSRDTLIRVGTIVGLSIPNFWLGLLLLLIFGLYVNGILPPGGFVPLTENPLDNLYHMILPVIVLGLPNLALISRILRSSMLDALARDYIVFARVMGLPERTVVSRIALPNAIIPTTTVVGLLLGYLIGGAVVVEVVFTIPGVGQLMVDSFQKNDYPVALGTTLFIATAFVTMNFVVDVLYAYLNPKIRDLYLGQLRSRDA